MKINRVNVVGEVLKYLEDNITSGVWNPGEKIDSELKLSEQLNVSHASVHSAIQQLVSLGVLESHQGRGTFVKAIPISEIKSRMGSITENTTLRRVIEFRVVLEGAVCMEIASHLTKETIERLNECLDGMKASVDDQKRQNLYDMEFHRALVAATHNDIMIRSLDLICDETVRINAIYSSLKSTRRAIMYHEQILERLIAGDGPGAREVLIEHLRVTPGVQPPFSDDSSLFAFADMGDAG